VGNTTALIWKILQVAESAFRRLKGAELLPAGYAGVQYVYGMQRAMSVPQKRADSSYGEDVSLLWWAQRSKEALCSARGAALRIPKEWPSVLSVALGSRSAVRAAGLRLQPRRSSVANVGRP